MNIEAYLDKLVPSSADNNRILRIRAEAYARNPLGMTFVGDGKLAVSQSVPELDCAVTRSRDDLTVVGRE